MQKKTIGIYGKERKWILVLFTVVYLALAAMYSLFNHPRPWTFYLGIFVDDWISFMPAWIVMYVIWYLYLPLIGLLLFVKDRQMYFRWILSFVLGMVSCFVIYSIFQTTVPRPDVSGPGLFYQMVRMVYSNDLPYNCFPSIHVLTSTISIIVLGKLQAYSRPLKAGLIVLGWLINFSTLFVKQHVFADLVSGVLLASCVYWASVRVGNRLYGANARQALQENIEAT